MTNKLTQKRLKFEFEFSIEMEEIAEEHLCSCEPLERLAELKRLQKALLKDRPALVEQMVARALGKLQEYVDYMASQEHMSALESVARGLEGDDPDTLLEKSGDFIDLTRPLRSNALPIRIESSAILEQVQGADGIPAWQPVWTDLLNETETGRQLKRFSIQQSAIPIDTSGTATHYLRARHLTRQCDGVHFEARCTCGELFTATAPDEADALQAVLTAFKQHHDIAEIGKKLLHRLKEVQSRYGTN